MYRCLKEARAARFTGSTEGRPMTLLRLLILSVAALAMQPAFEAPAAAQSGPAVKMSKSGICHPRGGTYYSRTKNFKPYSSMKACLEAGGRRPKR